jgi:hypothetical protein
VESESLEGYHASYESKHVQDRRLEHHVSFEDENENGF